MLEVSKMVLAPPDCLQEEWGRGGGGGHLCRGDGSTGCRNLRQLRYPRLETNHHAPEL